MYNYYPGNYPYAPPPQPSPEQVAKKQLCSDGNFVGVTMLFFIAASQLAFTIIVMLLVMLGVLPRENLMLEFLGLDNTTYLLVYAGVFTLNMTVPAPLAAAFCRRVRNPFSPVKPVPGGMIVLGIIGGVGVCMISNIVTTYLKMYLENIGVPMPEFPQLMENTWTSFGLNLLVIAVLPAVLEEMVFRGFVLQSLRRHGDGFAVFISALLFGLMHGNIVQVPFAFMVGLVIGWLYVVTDNIWIPILVHFFNNALSVCMEFIAYDMSDYTANWFYSLCIYGLAFVGGVALLSLILFYRRQLKAKPYDRTLTFGQRLGTLMKTPTFVISLIIFLILIGKELI